MEKKEATVFMGGQFPVSLVRKIEVFTSKTRATKIEVLQEAVQDWLKKQKGLRGTA